jgi:hypothetical protein
MTQFEIGYTLLLPLRPNTDTHDQSDKAVYVNNFLKLKIS